MNKTIFFLILAVCILGMALILLNQRLGRAPDPRPTARTEQNVVTDAPMTESAPEYPAPVPPATLPETIKRQAGSEHEAPDATAASAVKRKEVTSEPRGTSSAPATPPVTTKPPVLPKAPTVSVTTESTSRPAANETQRALTPERTVAPTKKTTNKEKATGSRAITRFVVFARDTGATVRLTGNGPLRYKSMNLDNPDRMVLDLEGDWEVKAPAIPKNPLVTAVRVGDMDGRTRIVIDLKGKPRTARIIPAKTGDGVDIRVDQ